MKAYERLLKYVVVRTPSDETSDTVPSSKCQFDLAGILVDELKELGVEAHVDEQCYVYGKIPATPGYESSPKIGFIAHMDTVSDFCDHEIVPVLHPDYDGKDLVLGESGRTLEVSAFPHLPELKGRTLITTDGTTVLGADDKAGIAEIITAVEYLQAHPEIKHGDIRIAFNPDEEIGLGAHKFDVERFGADWAYTMDGGAIGELEFENFNAASAKVTFKGRNVHPGYAKHKMINSIRIANQFSIMLPRWETPEHTEDYEGFYHLIGFEGTVEESKLTYIIRDHDRDRFERRKKELEHLVRKVNHEYPGCASIEIKDQYYNMREKIEPVMYIVDIAKQAMENADVAPKVQPIRGGTDGAQLSFKGLPCPNIFAGGLNFHGRYEFVPIPSMEKATDVVVEICKLVAQR